MESTQGHWGSNACGDGKVHVIPNKDKQVTVCETRKRMTGQPVRSLGACHEDRHYRIKPSIWFWKQKWQTSILSPLLGSQELKAMKKKWLKLKSLQEIFVDSKPTTILSDVRAKMCDEESSIVREQEDWSLLSNQIVGHEN